MPDWIGITVTGLCAAFSFYTALVMLEAGDTRGGAWLFGAFGCFFAIPICIAIIKAAAKQIPLFGRIDRALGRGLFGTEKPRPPFVPHWQMMTMIVIAIIGILAAIVVPIFIR